MEYQVPQFIEVEDKIIGPFTFKQFVYLAGGAGLCAVVFLYLPLVFAIIVAAPIAGLAGALAFYRVNGKPFIDILEAGFEYYLGGRLYLWKKEVKNVSQQPAPAPVPRQKLGLSQNKLHDLAWSLDVAHQGEPES